MDLFGLGGSSTSAAAPPRGGGCISPLFVPMTPEHDKPEDDVAALPHDMDDDMWDKLIDVLTSPQREQQQQQQQQHHQIHSTRRQQLSNPAIINAINNSAAALPQTPPSRHHHHHRRHRVKAYTDPDINSTDEGSVIDASAAKPSKRLKSSPAAAAARAAAIATNKPLYVCGECQRPYTTREGLRLHIRNIHAKDKRNRCTQCSATFVRRADLKLHLVRVHVPAVERPCPCDIPGCDKAFACKSELARHRKTHSGSSR